MEKNIDKTKFSFGYYQGFDLDSFLLNNSYIDFNTITLTEYGQVLDRITSLDKLIALVYNSTPNSVAMQILSTLLPEKVLILLEQAPCDKSIKGLMGIDHMITSFLEKKLDYDSVLKTTLDKSSLDLCVKTQNLPSNTK